MTRLPLIALLASAIAVAAGAQTPQPFPRAGTPQPARTAPAAPAPAPATQAAAVQPPAAPAGPIDPNAPTAATLGVAVYPAAQFLGSYDAGRGQRYYLYGVNLAYLETVNFYRTALKQKGEEMFQSPPTYQFDIGRFREQDMAYPPSVTIKDYTFGGSAGYPNPKSGQPERFPTIVQVVLAPAGMK